MEHLVIDHTLVAQGDHGVVLRVEQLLLEPPVLLEQRLVPAVRPPARPRPQAMEPARVVAAQVIDRLRRSPRFRGERFQPIQRRFRGSETRLVLLTLRTAVVFDPQPADERGQGEPLIDERHEDHAESQEDDPVPLGEGGAAGDGQGDRQRRGQRERAPDAGPAEDRRVLPGRGGIPLAQAAAQEPGQVSGGNDPDQPDEDARRADEERLADQRGNRDAGQGAEDARKLHADEDEEKAVE